MQVECVCVCVCVFVCDCGIDGRVPPGVELVAKFDSTRANFPDPNRVRFRSQVKFLDFEKTNNCESTCQ